MKCKVLIFLFCSITLVSSAQTEVKWDYPVEPGSEEWKMISYNEKVGRSQPPKELLKSWDTETLFKYCIDYPLNKVTLMYNNRNDGFKRVYEQATVWQEFIQRKDALDIFTRFFYDRTYNRLFEITNVEIRNNELFTLFFLEKLVSETDFALLLDSSQKWKLIDVILQNHQAKKSYPDELFGVPYNSSLCALLKILESKQIVLPNDEISLTKFREKTKNESLTDDNMESAIISKVLNYINKRQ